MEILEDQSIKITGSSNSTGGGYTQHSIYLEAGTYTFSVYVDGETTGAETKQIKLWNTKNGSGTTYFSKGFSNNLVTHTYTIANSGLYYIALYCGCNPQEVVNCKIQVEVGPIKTEYELYKESQTVIASADGSVDGIISITPTMTFISSGEVNIDITYRKNWGAEKQYNDFWDAYQKNGEKRSYAYAFYNYGKSWQKANFKPKYDIICEGVANNCFYAWENLSEPVDLSAVFKEQGIKLDTSKATNLVNFFAYGSSITGSLPTISLESAGGNTSALFRSCTNLTKIEKLIITEQTSFTSMFMYCQKLKEIIFEGIATQNINLQWSNKLNKESIISIINALSNSDSVSGMTLTLSATAVNAIDWSNTIIADITYNTFEDIINTKNNWTITLV